MNHSSHHIKEHHLRRVAYPGLYVSGGSIKVGCWGLKLKNLLVLTDKGQTLNLPPWGGGDPPPHSLATLHCEKNEIISFSQGRNGR